MRAGPMHDRIAIDESVDSLDATRAPKHSWSRIWECAAEIGTVSSRDYFTGTREEGVSTVRIRLRYPPPDVNVTLTCRVIDVARGFTYTIDSVLWDDKRTLMTLMCTSGASDGR